MNKPRYSRYSGFVAPSALVQKALVFWSLWISPSLIEPHDQIEVHPLTPKHGPIKVQNKIIGEETGRKLVNECPNRSPPLGLAKKMRHLWSRWKFYGWGLWRRSGRFYQSQKPDVRWFILCNFILYFQVSRYHILCDGISLDVTVRSVEEFPRCSKGIVIIT